MLLFKVEPMTLALLAEYATETELELKLAWP